MQFKRRISSSSYFRYKLSLLEVIFTLLLIEILSGGFSSVRVFGKSSSQEITSTGSKVFLPIILYTDVTRMRPYSDDSPWNTPIEPNPGLDPHSEEMITTFGLEGDGNIYTTTDIYSYPVYFVDGSSPRWDVSCTEYKCNIWSPVEVIKTHLLKDVPIPPNARPSSGSDAHLIIIDITNLAEYDLRGLTQTSTDWSVKNGAVYNLLWDGTPTRYGTGGAGVPYYAGLVRPWEIAQGHIDHALAFAYPSPALERCVYPASKTDGETTHPYAIPEGARVQLDPDLTDDDFERMGLDRAGIIIAKALQQYGMFLVNDSGRPKIYIENLADNPYTDRTWSDPDLNLTNKSIINIPLSYYRVIALPEAYWNSSLESPMHGNCFDYISP